MARGLILDYFGVLTSNMVDVISDFEAREGLLHGSFLRVWASPSGKELFASLELGAIGQEEWNIGFARLLGVPADGLMARYLAAAEPALAVLEVARQARAAGFRTAVLSNSLGRSPFDPYATAGLAEAFDEVILSTDYRIRKPDPRIFQLAADRLGLDPVDCVLVDDTEENLDAAAGLGMWVVHGLDEAEIVGEIRRIFALPRV